MRQPSETERRDGHGYLRDDNDFFPVETVRRVTGHPIPAVDAPRRPGDSPRLVASSEKIQRELGWKPQHVELQDIIASAWEWHKSHPKGYGAS